MSQKSFDYYQQVIATLDKQVAQLQAESRQHLQCKKGCSSCCENVRFKISYIEALQLTKGFAELPQLKKQAVVDNLKQESPDCPFLVEGSCAVYQFRPALCRAYGLLIQVGEALGTCSLNFNEIQAGEALKKLDILPYYRLLEDLSATLWKDVMKLSREVGPEPPKLSIPEFMNLLLSR
jgi:Fe-S-cluster containining protein